MVRKLALAIGCSITLACQDQTESLTGRYSGTLTSPQGVAVVVLDLTDVDGSLSGLAQATGLTFDQRVYYVTGSSTGDGIDIRISDGYELQHSALAVMGTCKYLLNGRAISSNVRGTYATVACHGGSAGTFELQRQ